MAKKGRIVGIPGMPGEKIDARILPDVLAIIKKYKVKITDGYAPTGHSPSGEHPAGLAADIVPGKGGTWDDVDRLAAAAKKSGVFRWIGYNGVPDHGRGNHLHLSWKGKGGGKPELFMGGDAGDALTTEPASLTEGAAGGGGGVLDYLAKEGSRVILTLVLVLGALVLAVLGLSRTTGVGAPAGAAA